MMKLRALRTRVGISVAAVALSGAGLGLATATPASATYAGYCNGWVDDEISNSGFHAKLPAYNGNVNCQMYKGASHNGVKALQITLNRCYGRSLTEDGVFGDRTRTALIYAQGQEKIGTDGGYGTDTRTNLEWAYQYSGNGRWSCF